MITEAELSYEDMKQAEAKGYLCGKCQGKLTVAWGGAHGVNGWLLRCSDITHTGMTRHDIKFEKEKQEDFSMDSTALTKMDEKAMIERVNMARFPQDLTLADKKLLAQVAITYGFDPLMGEVTIYQGRPFVSIDGRYRKAQETNNLDGVETRPATKEERDNWQIPEGDYFFRSEVYVKGSGRPFVAWGRVHKAETIGGKGFKPVEKNPQRMAEKRAEAQALRKAFHIPLPSAEDIGSPDYDIESTAREVDQTTGEILDKRGEFEKESRNLVEEALAKPKSPAVTSTTGPPPEESKEVEQVEAEPTIVIDMDKLKTDLDTLNWVTCGKWLSQHFGVTGRRISDIVKKLTPDQQREFAAEIEKRLEMS